MIHMRCVRSLTSNSIRCTDQPDFWRAMDTKGQNIDIPNCIDDLGYEFGK